MKNPNVTVVICKEKFMDLVMSLDTKDMTYVIIDVIYPARSTMTVKKWGMTFKVTE